MPSPPVNAGGSKNWRRTNKSQSRRENIQVRRIYRGFIKKIPQNFRFRSRGGGVDNFSMTPVCSIFCPFFQLFVDHAENTWRRSLPHRTAAPVAFGLPNSVGGIGAPGITGGVCIYRQNERIRRRRVSRKPWGSLEEVIPEDSSPCRRPRARPYRWYCMHAHGRSRSGPARRPSRAVTSPGRCSPNGIRPFPCIPTKKFHKKEDQDREVG